MTCTRCKKRLSRKTARQIDGKPVCSACMFAPAPAREKVREAISRIEPLPGEGPNRFSVHVPGWYLSAPNRKQLSLMLWHWFTFEDRST